MGRGQPEEGIAYTDALPARSLPARSAIAVRISPSLASQRPVKPRNGKPSTLGAGTSRRASKVPAVALRVISASSKPSQRPASGNHAL